MNDFSQIKLDQIRGLSVQEFCKYENQRNKFYKIALINRINS